MQEVNKKETASLAAIEKKLDVMIQHLSSINYLLLYGNQINKGEHYRELNNRLDSIKKANLEQAQ